MGELQASAAYAVGRCLSVMRYSTGEKGDKGAGLSLLDDEFQGDNATLQDRRRALGDLGQGLV